MPSRSTVRLYLRPSMFALHVPAVLAVGIAVLLGVWQLDSWQETRQDQAAELADVPPVPLAEVLGPDDRYPTAAVGRPVTVRGTWVPGSAVVVSDRAQGDEVGYWSVALAETCGAVTDCAEPAALPVVLGWSEQPATVVPTGAADLVGWLQPPESEGEPDADPTDDELTSMRVASLLQRADGDIYGAFLVLDEPAELREGLDAVTPDSLPAPPTSTGLRNLLYGLEWWVFAGFAVFLWWRWSRDEVRRAVARDREERVGLVSDQPQEEPTTDTAGLPSGP